MKTQSKDTVVDTFNIPKEVVLRDGRKLKRVTWKGIYGSIHVTWEIVK